MPSPLRRGGPGGLLLVAALALLASCISLPCLSAPGGAASYDTFAVALSEPLVSTALYQSAQYRVGAWKPLPTLFLTSRQQVQAIDPVTHELRWNESLALDGEGEGSAPARDSSSSTSAGQMTLDAQGDVWIVSSNSKRVLHWAPQQVAVESSEGFTTRDGIDLAEAGMGPADSVVLASLLMPTKPLEQQTGDASDAVPEPPQVHIAVFALPIAAAERRVPLLSLFNSTGGLVWTRTDLDSSTPEIASLVKKGCVDSPSRLQMMVPNGGRALSPAAGGDMPPLWVACGTAVFAVNASTGETLQAFSYPTPAGVEGSAAFPRFESSSPQSGDAFVSFSVTDGVRHIDRLTSTTATPKVHGMLLPLRRPESEALAPGLVSRMSVEGVSLAEDARACTIAGGGECRDQTLLQLVSVRPLGGGEPGQGSPTIEAAITWVGAYAAQQAPSEGPAEGVVPSTPSIQWDTSALNIRGSSFSVPVRHTPPAASSGANSGSSSSSDDNSGTFVWVVREAGSTPSAAYQLPKVLILRGSDGSLVRSFDTAQIAGLEAKESANPTDGGWLSTPPNCRVIDVLAQDASIILDCEEVYGRVVVIKEADDGWVSASEANEDKQGADTSNSSTGEGSSPSGSSTADSTADNTTDNNADDSNSADSSSADSITSDSSTADDSSADSSTSDDSTVPITPPDASTGESGSSDESSTAVSVSSSTADADDDDDAGGADDDESSTAPADDDDDDDGSEVPPADGTDDQTSVSSSSSSTAGAAGGGASVPDADDGVDDTASVVDPSGDVDDVGDGLRFFVASFSLLMLCAVLFLLYQWMARRREFAAGGAHMQLSQGTNLELAARTPRRGGGERVVGAGLMLDGSLDPDYDNDEDEFNGLDDLEAGSGLDRAWPSEERGGRGGGGGVGSGGGGHRSADHLSAHDRHMYELEQAIGAGLGGEGDYDDNEEPADLDDLEALRLEGDEDFHAAIGRQDHDSAGSQIR